MASAVFDVINAVVDSASFENLPEMPEERSPVRDEAYRARLGATRSQTNLDESIQVGTATVDGHTVVVIASAFEFLAGSIGHEAADRIVAAFDFATEGKLPVLALPCSGGTRMQEGTSAFFRMTDIASAVARHRASGAISIGWLRNPTTGGVLATWASLCTVTFAEPDALIGFLGPRIFHTVTHQEFPSGIQTAENLLRVGVIDAVVPIEHVRAALADVLAVADPRVDEAAPRQVNALAPSSISVNAAASLASCARPDRPTASDLLRQCTSITYLHGTGVGEYSPAVICALARVDGVGCVVIAQDRHAQERGNALGPEAIRCARRAIAIANELHLPIVTVVDTAGAELSASAEEGALAGEIARMLADLGTSAVPTLGVLLGSGCGGAALAFLATDFIVAAQHSWLAPLPLEGASTIRFRSASHVDRVATDLRITAPDLFEDGIVDEIVAESPDAADEPEEFLLRMFATISVRLRGELHG